LVDAQRGLRGGYVLARRPEELTMLDVINAVDPLERIALCPLGRTEHAGDLCSLHRRLDEAIGLVETLFRRTTVEQLIAERGAVQNPLCELVPGIGEAVVEPTIASGADRDGTVPQGPGPALAP
jgi:DNA-binding IscR family transcriptional regulator